MLDAVDIRKEIIRVDRLKQENSAEHDNETPGSEYEVSLSGILSYYSGYSDALKMVLAKSSNVADGGDDAVAPKRGRKPKSIVAGAVKRGRGRPRKVA